MVLDFPTLKDRLNQVHRRIQKAQNRSKQPKQAIRLVAVTKTVPVELINMAVQSGEMELGENKVQEARDKRSMIVVPEGQKLTHHLLGSLQTNKARKAVELSDLIQSVDRPKLAAFLDRVAGEMGKKQDCLIEVKVSTEPSKMGIPVSEASDFINGFKQYQNLNLNGLMTIAPFDRPENETRDCFREFFKFFKKHENHLGAEPILSMGMTDDFEIAIEEGSTMVRIGRAIFGERQSSVASSQSSD